MVEFFFGGVVAIGLGVIAAMATGVITSDQVTNVVYSVVDRAPAPPQPGTMTASVEAPDDRADADEVAARSERVRRQAVAVAGQRECADPNTVRGVVERYRQWADGDLALIACGRVRSGFTGDQVIASLGNPQQRVRRLDGTEEWRYGRRRVLIRQGQVVGDSAD